MNDLISRQEAIEAIEEYADRLQMVNWKENPNVPYKAYALNWCINTIRDLPSIDAVQYTDDEIQRMQDIEQAQIEKAYDLGYAEGKADAEPQWIPCSDRLPEESEQTYWCCSETGYQFQCRWTNNMYGLGATEYSKWGWHVMDKPQYSTVIAWMPLPKPYERKEE